MTETADDVVVMTSGAFTAAHLELVPCVERLTGKRVVTATTSVGTGDGSIENRLRRGERAELVIVSEGLLQQFVGDGLVRADECTPLARSTIGLAVRAGAPVPDVSSVDALRRTLLAAKAVAYSASVSGKYLTTELYQQLGIAEEMLPRSHLIGGGVRTGAVVARGDADIAFQQMSELLPVEGIAHVTPLPAALQRTTRFCAGIAATALDVGLARGVIAFLASADAVDAIARSGLEPLAGR
jgi:molybdate transport system substrate-binding protein